MTKRIGVVAVFLMGCAVGGGASAFVVPKASAQQAATLPRWEYTCIDNIEHLGRLISEGNRAGDQGWEMFTVLNGMACFKRPKL